MSAALYWSTTLPTKPGGYWCRLPKGDCKHLITIWAERTDAESDLYASSGGAGDPVPLSRWAKRGFEWAGPLPEPEEATP